MRVSPGLNHVGGESANRLVERLRDPASAAGVRQEGPPNQGRRGRDRGEGQEFEPHRGKGEQLADAEQVYPAR